MVKKTAQSSAIKQAKRPLRKAPQGIQPDIDVYDSGDPGDETQRNFRYQHAYGVILLAACLSAQKSYVALWCEHHEDFLTENGDGTYDAWQIKTRRPEIGDWQLNDDALRDSIKRFVLLEKKFPSRIQRFFFVSNVAVSKSKDKRKIAQSPQPFLQGVKSIKQSAQNIKFGGPYDLSFEALRRHCECTDKELLAVLLKLDFIKGPERDSFEDVIAHTHLPQIPGCDMHSPAVLNGLRDELIQAVYKASSLDVSDPAKHWYCLNGSGKTDPRLLAKRITIEMARQLISQVLPVPLRFTPRTRRYPLSFTQESLSVMEKKFLRGALGYYFENMQNCAHAAEAHLMELAYRKPKEIDKILDQLIGVVRKECDAARLQAQTSPEPYGVPMLREVTARFYNLVKASPQMVAGQTDYCLLGVAGLLTAECAIWWSEEFDLEEAA